MPINKEGAIHVICMHVRLYPMDSMIFGCGFC
jgi:hypothetical protein